MTTEKALKHIGELYAVEEEIHGLPATQHQFSQLVLKILELSNQLDPEVQRDLMRGAEDKQRVIEMEKQLKE